LNTAQAWGLTPREQEVWMLHQSGYTHSKIAEKLKISKNTVKKHMSSIHGKRRAGDFT
jgi:DNA-binding NarL/FixJ family response regulator